MNTEKAVETIIAEAAMNAPEGCFPTTWIVQTYRNSPVAGKASGPRTIKINADLAEQYPEQLRDTVLHEMAHCLVYRNIHHRCKPHGPEWQDYMHLLGVAPEVCHRMEQPDLIRKRHNTFPYRCACGTHNLKAGRHNKHICYGVNFTCRKCGTELEYTP
jgi:SprT protein